MAKNAEYPHRRSIRLEGYDYSQPGAYFITIVAFHRSCLFGVMSDDKVVLNPIGRLVEFEWQRLEQRFKHVELGAWIVMPNHIHGIVNIIENEVDWVKRIPNANEQSSQSLEQFASPVAGSIATTIRSFKSSVTQQYQNLYKDYSTKLWQRNYYDHIIRSETDLKNIYDYIVDNPRKWTEDENYSP